jgi:hypothetical protein
MGKIEITSYDDYIAKEAEAVRLQDMEPEPGTAVYEELKDIVDALLAYRHSRQYAFQVQHG